MAVRPAIEVRGLRKSYGEKVVLENLDCLTAELFGGARPMQRRVRPGEEACDQRTGQRVLDGIERALRLVLVEYVGQCRLLAQPLGAHRVQRSLEEPDP